MWHSAKAPSLRRGSGTLRHPTSEFSEMSIVREMWNLHEKVRGDVKIL